MTEWAANCCEYLCLLTVSSWSTCSSADRPSLPLSAGLHAASVSLCRDFVFASRFVPTEPSAHSTHAHSAHTLAGRVTNRATHPQEPARHVPPRWADAITPSRH